MPHAAFEHLGPFTDLVDAARENEPLFPRASTGVETRRRARETLRFTVGDERPADLRTERSWEADGVAGEEISWSVGFGPRTHAFLLKPAGSKGRLPAVVALHDHGHFKYFGKEKIADGPEGAPASLTGFRETYYGGRPFANLLARRGFAVLVPDVFLWGSRRFPLETMPAVDRALADAASTAVGLGSDDPQIARYNGAAYLHENLVEKYCTLLGTSIAAVVAYEDRVALNYLRGREDVGAGRLGCIGFSGGGLRAALIGAMAEEPIVRVIAGMMCTYDALLDSRVAPHTWMLFPAGWSRWGDVPDLASCAAPAPLLVQYLVDDAMFTAAGMKDADRYIGQRYADAGAPEAYRGEFRAGPHRFDADTQEAAFSWLVGRLGV